jgi:hypothetical protein
MINGRVNKNVTDQALVDEDKEILSESDIGDDDDQ